MTSLPWIDEILGTRAKVRVLRLLMTAPGRGWTEADIARLVRMSPNTVNLTVAGLVKDGVVAVETLGRTHRVTLNFSSPFMEPLVSLFGVESRLVDHLSKIAKETDPKASFVLFGSAARNEMRPGSDVDVLVVADTQDEADAAGLSFVLRARQALPARYDTIQLPRSKVRDRRTALFTNIRKEGILLSGPPVVGLA